mmetsp:Transcript_113420/g.196948  ORF Transcript_113420/g.196948 Transcript_113420/m.196948 type:complete len:216 (-) Transcript_113420:1383-2030(-)
MVLAQLLLNGAVVPRQSVVLLLDPGPDGPLCQLLEDRDEMALPILVVPLVELLQSALPAEDGSELPNQVNASWAEPLLQGLHVPSAGHHDPRAFLGRQGRQGRRQLRVRKGVLGAPHTALEGAPIVGDEQARLGRPPLLHQLLVAGVTEDPRLPSVLDALNLRLRIDESLGPVLDVVQLDDGLHAPEAVCLLPWPHLQGLLDGRRHLGQVTGVDQ